MHLPGFRVQLRLPKSSRVAQRACRPVTKNEYRALEGKGFNVAERERPIDCYQGPSRHVDQPTEQVKDLSSGKDLDVDSDLDMGLASSWLKRRCVGTTTLWEKKTLKGPKTSQRAIRRHLNHVALLLLKRANHIRRASP
jgi:hypothetical protein